MTAATVRSGGALPHGALSPGGLAAVGRCGRRSTPWRAVSVLVCALAFAFVFGLVFGSEGGGAAPAPAPSSTRPTSRQGVVPGGGYVLSQASRLPAATAARTPTVRELVGQRFVVALSGTSASPALLERVRRGEIGGVILFGSNVVGPAQLHRLTATLQNAARAARRPPLLIATDQEGGRVRRLPWAGPVPTTTALGRQGTTRIRAEALASGKALRLAGVNVNLAPVADVPGLGSFMQREERTFAASPAAVAGATVAFARGLAGSRVAAAVKHFPGIGRATRNTDRAAVEIDVSRREIESSDLEPFRAAIAGGVPIVMISNATYPGLDAKPAPWSTRLQSLLRDDLGFQGVTISDALDGAAATRGRAVTSVAVLAAQAGIDLLLLTGSEASSAAAFARVVGAAERGRISRTALEASYVRIMTLKRAYG